MSDRKVCFPPMDDECSKYPINALPTLGLLLVPFSSPAVDERVTIALVTRVAIRSLAGV